MTLRGKVLSLNLVCIHFLLKKFFSLTVHPNKLLVATGQASGHDRKEASVSDL